MAERFGQSLRRRLRAGEVTFGLREAVILAVVAIAGACAYVYFHVR